MEKAKKSSPPAGASGGLPASSRGPPHYTDPVLSLQQTADLPCNHTLLHTQLRRRRDAACLRADTHRTPPGAPFPTPLPPVLLPQPPHAALLSLPPSQREDRPPCKRPPTPCERAGTRCVCPPDDTHRPSRPARVTPPVPTCDVQRGPPTPRLQREKTASGAQSCTSRPGRWTAVMARFAASSRPLNRRLRAGGRTGTARR